MSNDFSQLLPTFLEESLENLDEMEETLLSLNLERIEIEKINNIFRAVHTLKGNSAIFKFTDIRDLMHGLETFLDLVKNQKSTFKKQHLDLFLQAVDVVRNMLYEIKKKQSYDRSACQDLILKIRDELENESPEQEKSIEKEKSIEEKKSKNLQGNQKIESITTSSEVVESWLINFTPKSECFKMGRDPARLFSALKELGTLEIKTEQAGLKDFFSFDPSLCYLAWTLNLTTKIQKDEIEKILLWVANKNEFEIQELNIRALKPEVKDKIDIMPKRETLSSIRVATEKIDNLMNIVGELVIVESMLNDNIKKLDPHKLSNLQDKLDLLEHNTRELQDNVLRVRMVPISFAVSRFPRMVLDIADKMGKKVAFTITGEETEVDKGMIEKISDPILHLIRNAVDHGIEFPEERSKANKNPVGSLRLNAYQESTHIVIELIDDGQGLNIDRIKKVAIEKGLINSDNKLSEQEIIQLIFKPGFSTSEQVTELSGRGIGLDVVEKNIGALGGKIDVVTAKGYGTTFKISLPLTLAIIDCQLIKIASQTYAIPLANIEEMQAIDPGNVKIENKKAYYKIRNQEFEMIYLDKLLQSNRTNNMSINSFMLMIKHNTKQYGLVCDELLVQQPVVIKNLEENFHRIYGVIGGSILGNGEVAIILDVNEIIEYLIKDVNTNNLKNTIDDAYTFGQLQDNILGNLENNLDLISFSIGKYEYGIEMKEVKEICPWQNPATLPFSEFYLLGIINLRGQIVPLINLKSLFSQKAIMNEHYKMIIVISLKKKDEKKLVGIAVDSIVDAYSIQKNTIKPISTLSYFTLKNYLIGLTVVQKRLISVLNLYKLSQLFVGEEIIHD